jgi:hypothetical protein
MERRHAVHVEGDCGEIAWLAVEERDDGVDCAVHVGRRSGFAGSGESPEHAGASLSIA